MDAVEKVVEKWRRDGLDLLKPSSESDVIAAFMKIGGQVSRDVINLYCAVGGMNDEDSFLWSLWSLERVVAENESRSRPHIWFADSMIDAYRYCFKYEGADNSSVCVDWLNGEEPERVANHVNEFFTLYLEDPAKILL
jgi:hypothetical protein